MATRKREASSGNVREAPGTRPPSEKRTASKGATKTPPANNGTATKQPTRAPTEQGAKRKAAPGLDDAQHAAAQRAAHDADMLRKGLFPILMADALGYSSAFNPHAYKLYLDKLLEDAGNPDDPIEHMMIEQLALAHFRIAQLHASAGQAKGIEAAKIYNAAAARMLGEFRRTALGLRAYRTRVPEGRPEADAAKMKLYKAAQ